jgi:predicted transcriptional regulator
MRTGARTPATSSTCIVVGPLQRLSASTSTPRSVQEGAAGTALLQQARADKRVNGIQRAAALATGPQRLQRPQQHATLGEYNKSVQHLEWARHPQGTSSQGDPPC